MLRPGQNAAAGSFLFRYGQSQPAQPDTGCGQRCPEQLEQVVGSGHQCPGLTESYFIPSLLG
jgi:hypothetical protein